jgi:hypothetical protein
MKKVVYNACYGGFGLSNAAIARGREVSGDPLWERSAEAHRSDPVLVQVVAEMGVSANGRFAMLKTEDVAPGTRYRIIEYDGKEWVETPDSID